MACLLSSIPRPFTAAVRVHRPHVAIDFSPTRIDNLRARTRNPITRRADILFRTRAAFGSTIATAATLDSYIVGNKQRTTCDHVHAPRATIYTTFATHHATTGADHRKHPKTATGKGPMHHWCGRPLRGFDAHPKQRTRGARRAHVAHALRDGQQKRTRSISCSRRPLLTSFTASPRYRSARNTLVIGRQAGAMAPPTDVGKP